MAEKEIKYSPHPCTWCGGQVVKPRRNWCSDECVLQFTRRNHQAAFRSFVWEKSNKCCKSCGIDLDAIERLLSSVRDFSKREKLKELFGISAASQLWQADHILPQAMNGHDIDPKLNGQVLCHQCHVVKTKADVVAIKEYSPSRKQG